MKKILFLLSLLLLVASCRKENDRPILPLRLGEEDAKELQLTQSETRMILLKGGDGKYTATIEDARIASSSISRDTLRVSGLLYGETSLTLRSHDEVRRVRVLVVPPPFASNEDAVTLRPGDDVQTLSLSGGGARASLKVEDPEKAADIVWQAETGLVKIKAKYEGDIKLIATSEDGKTTKEILVKVRCAGSADRFGVYITNSRQLSQLFPCRIMARLKGKSVRFSESAIPVLRTKKGLTPESRVNRVLTLTPEIVAPVVGEARKVKIDWLDASIFYKEHPLKREGEYTVYVEEVRDRQVVLRGRGFKIVAPYRKD